MSEMSIYDLNREIAVLRDEDEQEDMLVDTGEGFEEILYTVHVPNYGDDWAACGLLLEEMADASFDIVLTHAPATALSTESGPACYVRDEAGTGRLVSIASGGGETWRMAIARAYRNWREKKE